MRKIWSSIAMLLSLVLVPTSATPQDLAPISGDSALIALALTVISQADEVDAVWPGFWRSPRFALYRGGGPAFLFTDGRPFEGAERITAHEFPAGLRQHGYVLAHDRIPRSGRITPGDPTPYVLDLGNIFVSPLTLLLHEAFHMWQRSHFAHVSFDYCAPQDLPAELPEPGTFGTRLVEELRQLIAAIGTPGDMRQRAVEEYLGLRLARLSSSPVVVSYTEQRQEREEGTAQFVGTYAALRLSNGTPRLLEDSIAGSLHIVAREWEQSARLQELPPRRTLARMYWYYSGAALSLLLDMLEVKGWRENVRDGQSLDEILARRVGAHEYLAWHAARPELRSLCPTR